MLLTDAQLQAIRQIVADHHNAFIANTVSPDVIAPDILAALKAKGLINVEVSSIQDAYTYGQIVAAMDDPKTAKMSLAQFRHYIQRNPVSLTAAENHAITLAQHQAANYVVGLGARVNAQTGQMLVDADENLRRLQRDAIRTKTAANIDARQTVKQLKSDLGHATGDWTRDLERVATTEKQNAMQQGVADAIAKQEPDPDVCVRASPRCCDTCGELFNGPDGHPIVFKLSELESNGSNVGKTRSEWKPCVPTVHPNCTCQMQRVPKGWSFNTKGVLTPSGQELGKSEAVQSRLRFQGLPVAIEYPAGSFKTLPNGTRRRYLYAYGFIEGSMGADGEELDCYIGDNPNADAAYIVHQLRPHSETYDEDKVMLGFDSAQSAETAYRQMYDLPQFFGAISPVPMEQFKQMVAAQQHTPEAPTLVPVPVIPLSKSRDGQRVSSDEGSAGSEISRREIRTNAADGSNFLFNVPVRAGKNRETPPDDAALSIRRFLMEVDDDPALAPHLDADDLDIVQATPVLVHKLHIVVPSKQDKEAQTKNAAAYKEALKFDYDNEIRGIANRMPVDGRRPVLGSEVTKAFGLDLPHLEP